MLLIVLALVCLSASFNADAVAEWHWNYTYNSKKEAAERLLSQNFVRGNAVLERRASWAPGESISFKIQTAHGPVAVNYQPRREEVGYINRAMRGGQFAVYYRQSLPKNCVLESTWLSAKSFVNRPMPKRVPGDRISKYLDLWGKALALILMFFGVTSVAKNSM